MSRTPSWMSAASFAARAHQGHVRKDGRTPYFAHPARVAMICATIFGAADDAVLTAAYLHDVLEDCDCDFDEIEEQFGREVAEIVAALSKDMRLPEPQREAEYDRQLAAGPWQARLIKLADVFDNVSDAQTGRARAKGIDRARRALKLAENDPQCAEACRIVRSLVESVEQ